MLPPPISEPWKYGISRAKIQIKNLCLETHINVQIFRRVYVSKHWLYQINKHESSSIFSTLCLFIMYFLIFARIVFFPFLHFFWLTSFSRITVFVPVLHSNSYLLSETHIQQVSSLPCFFLYDVSILSGESIPLFCCCQWMYR